ncbi:HNH endonuclease family protein [Streptomyces meridianus]|uniref:HNH endonuclease family protein n=1 Tax=Streptomyces meridianus TaxID=2938945 RepID=A0ABT0X9U3_9ACTN|nr:HNH endonuclease family protein [Streptomyces meridianus]MCM2579298.1 HNH endonuclease family protein [Streptomyces meridianus]
MSHIAETRRGFYARRRSLVPRRLVKAGAAVAAGVLGSLLLSAPPAQAAPPTPIAASTARTYLYELTLKAEGSTSGYSRDLFPHWITQSGTCDTREQVLKRDGTNVVTNSSCQATSGSWYSPYDGATWYASSDVDIDHVVPLAEAWTSGANSWSTSQRQAFANDLSEPQLIAVTDNVNQSKSDKDPAEWLPPRSAYHCMYARMWVDIKHGYDLSVDQAERDALYNVLKNC